MRLQCHKEKRDIEPNLLLCLLYVFFVCFFFSQKIKEEGLLFFLLFITALWHTKCWSNWIDINGRWAAVTNIFFFFYLFLFFICSYIYVSTVNSILTVGLYYWWKIVKNLLFFIMKLPISLVWWDYYLFFYLLLLNYCLQLYAVCFLKAFRIQRFPSVLLIVLVSAYSEITWAVRLAAVKVPAVSVHIKQ